MGALQASEEMTRSVRDNLCMDVTTITKKEMRQPSFMSRLDVNNASPNTSGMLRSSSASSSQAAKKATPLPALRDGSKEPSSGRAGSNSGAQSKAPGRAYGP